MLEYGFEHKCTKCGIGDLWDNTKLVLEIDHIDADWKNNEPCNLRFLCPNCHSQIKNFHHKLKQKSTSKKISLSKKDLCECGEVKKVISKHCRKCMGLSYRKVSKPDKILLEQLITTRPLTAIAKEYGVSDKTVAKWCKSYQICSKPRGYWS